MRTQSTEPTETTITDAMVEAAARVIAHREEFNASKWRKYAEVARAALAAALGEAGR